MKNSSSCQISAAAAVRSIRWWNICTSSSRGVELFSIEKNWTVNWLNGINRNRSIIDSIVGRRVNSWGPIKTHSPFYSLRTVCCFGLPRAQHCGSRGPLDLPLISGQRANWWGRKEEGGGTSSAQSSTLWASKSTADRPDRRGLPNRYFARPAVHHGRGPTAGSSSQFTAKRPALPSLSSTPHVIICVSTWLTGHTFNQINLRNRVKGRLLTFVRR